MTDCQKNRTVNVGKMYSPEQIERIVSMARSQKLAKLKIEGLEIEFSSEAYLEDLRKATAEGPITKAIEDEDLLFHSST